MVKLLVENGADIKSVEMNWVFDTWDPEIMKYFIDHGADAETDNPLAAALCWKIRTALGIFKQYKNQFSSFQEQANIALRHHCREGNLKWVSLMLWAGADPFAKGPDSPDENPDPDENLCALEYAALYGHFDIFKLKQVQLNPDHPIANNLLSNACCGDNANLLIELIKQGFSPSDQKDCGSSLIQNFKTFNTLLTQNCGIQRVQAIFSSLTFLNYLAWGHNKNTVLFQLTDYAFFSREFK